jgi:hypothetical protein
LWRDGDDDFTACIGISEGVGAFAVDGEVFVVNVFDGSDAVAFI